MNKINIALTVITLIILSASNIYPVQKKLLVEISPGHKFVGGTPPKIVGVKKVRTIYKEKKPYHIYRITFRRAGLDNGRGWYASMRADTWGDLFKSKKLEKDVVAVKWLREKNVSAKWNKKFPTLKCYIKYLIAFKTEDGWHLNRTWIKKGKGKIEKPAVRNRHKSNPKLLVTEYLVKGLPPGSYRLELRASTTYDRNHTLIKGKTIAELISYFVLGKIESFVKTAVVKYSTITVAAYTLNVPAKVPKVEGKNIKEARQIIQDHSLTVFYDPEDTGDIKKDGKVRLQDPVAGTLLDKGDRVGLTYYKYSPDLDKKSSKVGIIGKWLWFNGATVTFHANGSAVATNNARGSWKCTDFAKGKYIITWTGGWVDTLTLSSDGQVLSGKNNVKSHVDARRIN